MKKLGQTRQRIVELLRNQRLSPSDIQQKIGISAPVVYAHLRFLVERGFIKKFGSAPRVLYTVREKTSIDVVDEHFVFQDSLGGLHFGMNGFHLWSDRGLKKLSFEEKVDRYAERISAMESNNHDGFFDMIKKLQNIVALGEDIYLKEMVCLSLRSVQDFGRTKMGVYMDVVKSVANMKFMDVVLDFATPLIIAYAKKKQVNAIGFIPPTRKRSKQIMTLLEKRIRKSPLRVAVIDIKKIRADTPREQKTIRDLQGRIYNADHTFLISQYSHVHNYKKILLVDDFIGSGTTLNQVAKMLRQRGFAGETFGLGVVGEERGYSVEKVS